MQAYAADTGKLRWQQQLPFGGNAVAAAGNDLVVQGMTGLYGFNAVTGAPRWKRADLVGQPPFGPVLSGSAVYVNLGPTLGSRSVASIRLSDGRTLWRHDLTGIYGCLSGPAVDGSRVVVAGCPGTGTNRDDVTFSGQVLALDAARGTVVWSRSLGDQPAYTVTIGGGKVFYQTADGFLTALDAASGGQRWRVSWPARYPDSTVFAVTPSAVVVSGGANGQVAALDPANGVPRWHVDLSAPDGWEWAAVSGSLVYVTGDDYAINVLRLQNGAPVARLETGGSSEFPPVLSRDRLFSVRWGCMRAVVPALAAWQIS